MADLKPLDPQVIETGEIETRDDNVHSALILYSDRVSKHSGERPVGGGQEVDQGPSGVEKVVDSEPTTDAQEVRELPSTLNAAAGEVTTSGGHEVDEVPAGDEQNTDMATSDKEDEAEDIAADDEHLSRGMLIFIILHITTLILFPQEITMFLSLTPVYCLLSCYVTRWQTTKNRSRTMKVTLSHFLPSSTFFSPPHYICFRYLYLFLHLDES